MARHLKRIKPTSLIHFTYSDPKVDRLPAVVKGQAVYPKDHVKILGVILDYKLKYRQHVAYAASKGLEAAMELKRPNSLSAGAQAIVGTDQSFSE